MRLNNLQLVDNEYQEFERFTKKRKRKTTNNGLDLIEIEPLTKSQQDVFESYKEGYNLVLHGCAGTGKTFLSLYLAIEEVLAKESLRKKIMIVRSVVPTRDMGFLPGNVTEKSKVYETPYHKMVNDIFGRGDAYGLLKSKGIIEFTTTSFVRGETWDDTIIIVDEFQNMSFQELHSVITRMGENTRIIFSGDGNQDDLTSERFKEESGILKFMRILNEMDSFDVVDFSPSDIVRSGIVREYIETCYRMKIH